jgi:cytochrome o ubiquinol oxidase subunit III
MSDAAVAFPGSDPRQLGRMTGTVEHSGPASKRIVTGYGFWIFILSDMVMFSAFFATYAVLLGQTAGGPSGHDLFNPRNVAVETGFLLASSFTCGLASIAADTRHTIRFQLAMAVTCALGLGFLAIELREFADLVARGAGPTRSAFLSAFFTLVGCHGLHVSAGMLWLLTMMAQVFAKGFRADIQRRILCFALFWHALDIIWIAVFTVVYLIGSAR